MLRSVGIYAVVGVGVRPLGVAIFDRRLGEKGMGVYASSPCGAFGVGVEEVRVRLGSGPK